MVANKGSLVKTGVSTCGEAIFVVGRHRSRCAPTEVFSGAGLGV